MAISKRGTAYVELPEELRTANLRDAKIEVTMTITLGKRMERDHAKSAEKFIQKRMDEIAKDFRKYIRKQCDKE